MRLFLASALFVIPFLPPAASGQSLSREELIAYASAHQLCGEKAVIDARSLGNGRARLTCGEVTAFVPALGAIAATSGFAVSAGILLAAGQGNGATTPSTTAE